MKRMAILLLAASAVPVRAGPSLEALHSLSGTARPLPQALPEGPREPSPEELAGFLEGWVKRAEPLPGEKPAAAPSAVVDLAAVLNAYQRTEARFDLNGRPVTTGFGLSRGEHGYLSVLPEGDAQPQLLNIRGLMNRKQELRAHGARYEASLSPNIFDQLGSRLRIQRSGEGRSFTIRQLISATLPKGVVYSAGPRAYRLFYLDDILEAQGRGSVDPSKRNLAFVLQKGDDFGIFILPFEQVPSDSTAVFRLDGSDRVGLQAGEERSRLVLSPSR